MPVSDVNALRKSRIVRRIVRSQVDSTGEAYVLKVRVELTNGWLMDFWEHGTSNLRRYSFHVFQKRRIIIRWDNAPHHPEVRTFPHHKHTAKRRIEESEEMTTSLVLRELEKMILINEP